MMARRIGCLCTLKYIENYACLQWLCSQVVGDNSEHHLSEGQKPTMGAVIKLYLKDTSQKSCKNVLEW